ncbi:precorrin-6Y C5,15-methyltransferase (decarboxylating) [Vibrio diazotrophicus]|uniref:Precorrin-6Y C5,15-methyltransferase (Decarboxylating) n=1 Tax=Vibrio diazotrophicus TaxID=685 RepID=A0A2J8GMN1_VIBDI|nr:cobalt-precorrin-7 (C(5))-methyltransferase [Vibrio diazotrophicus]PNH87279.1 cobalt-precorrin-7 (C(5))-methyltransferase [Vibrio diazotrophicus]RAS60565.1 precorrin-6Y C5,15-methyltransferase (decarboxylating) [Vibrio diazotrophicus]
MIYVVGTGPGRRDLMTVAGENLIAKADVLVGWPRLLSAFSDFKGQRIELSGSIESTLATLEEFKSQLVVVLASGDPMLFGIGKRISEHFTPDQRRCVPGISSIQMLFSEVGIDMNDLYITSSHGKQPDFDFLFLHKKIALVTDKILGPYEIAQEAIKRNLKCSVIVGENLGYENQKISVLKPEQVQREYDMNVVVVMNERQ